jgi:tetratricopeptide (TPR) repeat protein
MRSRLDEATSINDSILKSLPKDIDALVLRGQILTHQGQPSDAIHFLESAIKDAPNDTMAHYYLGVAYADTSSFGQAEAEWREAARLQPQMAETQRSLVNIALRKGDVSLLSESAEQLMKIEPRAAEGYVYHSQAMLNAGEKAEAEADLKKAIDVAPDDPTAYVRLGDLRMIQKHYDEAEKFYTEALSRDPHVGDALTGLVNIDLTHEQPARALRRVEDQIAKVPSSSVYYVLLGQVQLKKGDPEKAEEAFAKAVELDKKNVPAFLLLAGARIARGSVDQAIRDYQQALQNNPRDIRLYVSLGGLLETRGEWQQAEVSYQKALQIQSDFPVAANNLAYLMLEHGGNVSVALSLAQTARKGLPNLPNSADTLGWAYYNQGAYSSAIDTLQEAVKADPKNPTYHYHLGMAYQKTNNIAMAKKELEHTLQISPDYSKAAEIRKMLADSVQKD